jgi:hypothetical protein
VSRRRDVRDRWYAEVIQTRAVSGSCRELLAHIAVKHMTELGHVKVPRRDLAAALGITEHRVTVRMGEAVKAGLLDRIAGGVNAQTMQYGARFPNGQGVGSRHPRSEVEVSGKRHPQNDTQESPPGCRNPAPIRARVPKNNREQEPAPAGGRVEHEHDATSQAGTYRGWPSTLSKRPSLDTTAGEVA